MGMVLCVAVLSLTACEGGTPAEPTAPLPVTGAVTPALQTTEPVSDGQGEATPEAIPVAVTLSVEPEAIAVGETAEVVLSVAEVVELYGVEAHLRFDPALLEVVDASGKTEGVRLEDGGLLEVGFTVVNAVDSAGGIVEYAVAQMPPSKAVTGSGDLLRFLIRAKAQGATTLQVESVILASAKGDAIPLANDVTGAALAIR